jgi:tRNA1Val (adenine37-N6)-methyltransferase
LKEKNKVLAIFAANISALPEIENAFTESSSKLAKGYFRFKQFTVWQDQCAMKVCTDACILGASADVANAQRILDIGTGTGLLSLMLAQRSPARIDAVEMDEAAYRQASQNVALSPFSDRIRVHHGRIQDFADPQLDSYDLIISNPPFFENHLRSPDRSRNDALHTATLSLGELLNAITCLLNPAGKCSILLPVYESRLLEEAASSRGLFTVHRLKVRHSPMHPLFRIVTTIAKSPAPVREEELSIYEADQVYSESFRTLLRDYYLIF